jgi:hypothetical protein
MSNVEEKREDGAGDPLKTFLKEYIIDRGTR